MANTQYNEFHQKLISFRIKTKTIQLKLTNKYNLSDEASPLLAFNLIFNSATFSAEHSSHYLCCDEDQPINDITEIDARLMLLAKSLFIHCMSITEYCSKRAIIDFPGIIKIDRDRETLREIMKKSNQAHIINDQNRNLWRGAIEERNRHVHNNGYSTRNEIWKFTNALKINMVDGEMNIESIMYFLLLTEWIIEAFASWSDKFLGETANI